jgi:hypothetical protein
MRESGTELWAETSRREDAVEYQADKGETGADCSVFRTTDGDYTGRPTNFVVGLQFASGIFLFRE